MHWWALASWKLKRPAVATGFGATSGFPDAPRADDLRLALRSSPTSEGGEFCTDLPINKSRRRQTHGEQELVAMWDKQVHSRSFEEKSDFLGGGYNLADIIRNKEQGTF